MRRNLTGRIPRSSTISRNSAARSATKDRAPATEYKESIGNVKYWDKPILPREYMEASCGKCHKEADVPQAPVLNLGRKLIRESNCAGCHKIEGYEKQWVPSLSGIGSKVNRAWLVNWLKNPAGYCAEDEDAEFSSER